jgi:hypothetical protein
MAIVYQHIRKDTNEVFYIGIGKSLNRMQSKLSRNPMWHNIVNKTEYIAEIIEDGLSWENACIKEKELIGFYGRRDLNKGPLVNMTDGGDGQLGLIHTKNTKKLISNKLIGKPKTIEWKLKNKEHLNLIGKRDKTGQKNPNFGNSGIYNSLSKKVLQIHKETNEIINIFGSIMEVERATKISYVHISRCCNNKPKYKTAGGYKWQFIIE